MKAITRFDIYLKSHGIPIHGISSSGPDCRIDFKDEVTEEQKEFANASRKTFDWEDKLDADIEGFKAAVYKSISGVPRLELVKLFPLLDSYAISNPGLVSSFWEEMKIQDYTWLTPEIIKQVEGIALEHHFVL